MSQQDGAEQPTQKDNNVISIYVKDQDGGELMFKVKPTTRLGKVIDAYCAKKSKDKETIRFLFEGERVMEDQTPADLGIENDDSIDVVSAQVGGCFGSR